MEQIKLLLLALAGFAGLSIDLGSHAAGEDGFVLVRNLVDSFQGFDLARALLIPGLYLLLRQAGRVPRPRKRWTHALPAAFFALNMLLGRAFAQEGSWSGLWRLSDGQLLKTLFAGLAWFLVLDRGLILIYHGLDRLRLQAPAPLPEKAAGFHPVRWYARMLRAHAFLTPFVTLLVLYLPHMLISFPAMFMGDTWSEIVQAYPELGLTGTDFLSPDRIMKAGVYINQNHPVFHTLCLHLCLRIGDGVFHSFNAGIFLYALCQALLLMAASAFAVSTLSRRGVRTGWLMALIGYVFLHPQVHNFLFLVTKDVPYAACLLLELTCLFRLRVGEGEKRDWALLGLAALGVILFRNEGRLVILLSGVLMALADRKHWKALLSGTAALALTSVLIFNLLYPALGYTPGSIREVLSVPFQQTARFVRDHGEEVTAEEREAIDGVLDYDALAENYDPLDADPVKETFRQEATAEELQAFLRAWAGMGARHPDTFLQAAVENHEEYFYPADVQMSHYNYGWSAWMCEYANQRIVPLGKQFSLPEWSRRARYLSDSLFDAGLLKLPPLSIVMTPALYVWGLLILLCWSANREREERALQRLLLIPLAVIVLLLLFGPTNGGYGRYLLPMTLSLPGLALMALSARREDGGRAECSVRRHPRKNHRKGAK